jgi:hypothetical protein
MSIKIHNNLFQTPLLLATIAFFGAIYGRMIMMLPLFGDATIHGSNAVDVLNGGWRSLNADYPGLYSYLLAPGRALIGESWDKIVVLSGFIFLLLAVYLLVRHFANNFYLGLLAVALAACSPKIILYSAKMYQEILISGLIIYCVYILFRYFEVRSAHFYWLLVLLLGTILSLKQQGLFILYPSIIIFFFIKYLKKEVIPKQLVGIILIPLLLALAPYGVLFHNQGLIQPGSDEFLPLRLVNDVGKKVFSYKPTEPKLNQPVNQSQEIKTSQIQAGDQLTMQNTGTSLEQNLEHVEKDKSTIAFSRAEARHVWPTSVFTNFNSFNEANNLYVQSFQGKALEESFVLFACFALVIFGVLYCIKYRTEYSNLLIFSAIFLSINYILFIRNNDQQRYQLFIALFLLSYIFIAADFIRKRLNLNTWFKLSTFTISALIVFTPILLPRIDLNKRWGNTQIYSSSIGGIGSVKEAGNWLRTYTPKNTVVGQQCGNETHYYSSRKVVGDWRAYFLDDKSFKDFIKNNDISYYVIYKSQLVDDKDWHHICWVPNSFYTKLNNEYKKAYTTNAGDIIVYKVV